MLFTIISPLECWLAFPAMKCSSITSVKKQLLFQCAIYCKNSESEAFIFGRTGSYECDEDGCTCSCVDLSTCEKTPDVNFHLYEIGPPPAGIN